MCMFYSRPKRKLLTHPIKAYKAITKNYCFPVMGGAITPGQWMNSGGHSTLGYHVFLTREGAKAWAIDFPSGGKIVEVRVRGQVFGEGHYKEYGKWTAGKGHEITKHSGLRVNELFVPTPTIAAKWRKARRTRIAKMLKTRALNKRKAARKARR